MNSWDDYFRAGLNGVRSKNGRVRYSGRHSIVFQNGYVASILNLTSGGYSVAACDWDGYFYWDVFPEEDRSTYGGRLCNTEKDVCTALDVISKLLPIDNQ